MSERRASPADPEDLQAQVDSVADVLYGLPIDEFSDARDQYVRQAREQKNAPLARELGKLRKPTQSAWLINLLWRDQRQVIEQLFELASELSQAQSAAAGPLLRELTQQRRQLEAALLRQAVALAGQHGVRVSDSVTREAQETLSAALALPEVADEVRSGHLVKAATYAGFGGPAAPARPTPSPRREPIDLAAIQRARAAERSSRAAPPEQKAAPTDEAESEAARRAEREEAERLAREEEEERRRAAERRLADARRTADAAQSELSRASRSLAAAEQRRDDLRQQLDTLREQVRRMESTVASAEQGADEARSEREKAQAAVADADLQVRDAEAALRG